MTPFLLDFVSSLGLLLPDSMILLAAKMPVCQNSELLLRHSGGEPKVTICCRHSARGIPTFFCARQGFMGKMFFYFYFKTCSDTEIICVYGLMFFSLRFNVLFPDNHLFFREIIRYIEMRIVIVCARIRIIL